MTDSPIPLALTPEQWALKPPTSSRDPRPYIDCGEVQRWDATEIWYGFEYRIEQPHAIAALCLYGQPYGFTHEDVALLTGSAEALLDRERLAPMGAIPRLNALAAKITALLPPSPQDVR